MTKKTYKFMTKVILKGKDRFEQIPEEENLKTKIGKLLHDEGYKFVIAGEESLN